MIRGESKIGTNGYGEERKPLVPLYPLVSEFAYRNPVPPGEVFRTLKEFTDSNFLDGAERAFILDQLDQAVINGEPNIEKLHPGVRELGETLARIRLLPIQTPQRI